MEAALDLALAQFVSGAEERIAAYVAGKPDGGWVHDGNNGVQFCLLWGPRLTVQKGRKYAKVNGATQRGAFTYTFAVIEIATGNVYRPSSSLGGTINLRTAKVRGNIFDPDHGLSQVNHNGPSADYAKNKPAHLRAAYVRMQSDLTRRIMDPETSANVREALSRQREQYGRDAQDPRYM